MKFKRILLTATLTAAMVVTSVVPALAETSAQEPAVEEMDIMVISPAPDAEWTTSGLKAAKVSLTSVKSYRYDKVKLTWETLKGVDGYQVYRATSKTGTYKRVASVKGDSAATYINTGLTCGKTYYYKVRAYKKIGGKTVYSKFSAIVSGKPVPSKTAVIDAWGSAVTSLTTTIQWKPVAGATDYEVQYRYIMPGEPNRKVYVGPIHLDEVGLVKYDTTNGEKTSSWKTSTKNMDNDTYTFNTYNQLMKETKKEYPSGYVTGVVLAGYPQGSKIPIKEYVETKLKKDQASIRWLPQVDDWKYQFRVRAYRTVAGKKVYGPWSAPYTMKETLDVEAAYKELEAYAKSYAAKNLPEWKYDDREIYHGIDADASYYIEGDLGSSSIYVKQDDFVSCYKRGIGEYIRRMKSSGGQESGFIYIKKCRPGETEGIHDNNSDETHYIVWMLY